MKTIEDIRLEAKVSDMIYNKFEDLVDAIDSSALMGMCEALAMDVIKTVKEQ